MHLVEQIGSGVNRMNNLIKEAGLPQPVFHTEGMFSVSFRRPGKAVEEPSEKTMEETVKETVKGIVEETSEKTMEATSEKTSEKIIKLIKNNPEITIDELADHLGRSTRAVEMQLQKLKEQKKIERIGPDKGGYWQLTTNRNS